MAITYEFRINGVEIEEPLGFSEFAINVKRDPDTHGVMFESSVGELGFYGEASHLLEDLEATFGLEAQAELEIKAICGEEVDLIRGNLLFARYRRTCGDAGCIVYMPLEQNDCTLTIRNRYDQKADLDKATSFNGITGLQDYAGLSFPLSLAPQALDARAEAGVKDEGDITNYKIIHLDLDTFQAELRPSYEKTVFDSIDSQEFIPSVAATQMEQLNDLISPFLLFDDNVDCFQDGVFNYEFRFKGRYTVDTTLFDAASNLFIAYFDGVGVWDGTPGAVFLDFFEIFNNDLYEPGTVVEFDHTFTGTISMVSGRGLYGYVAIGAGNSDENEPNIRVEWDKETYGLIYKEKLCPATEADVSLINETGSRIIEAITDGCVRMKSDYYGRIDSEPYASASDGCGSLRVLTSGLKLRKADNPVQFLSMEDFFRGLRAIDNVGWGIEPDTELGGNAQWVRMEPAEYFYKNELLFSMPSIPEGEFVVDTTYAYSQVLVGYERWETQRINGLHEFNSNKVFRTGLKTINNQLEITSGLVASGQAIEVTRQQSFADSGAADTTYDNETFIICVDRAGYGYSVYGEDYIVEQNNIGNPSGIFSPSTAYNWRIRPRYNLMRWWKSVMQSYANLVNSTSRLYFGSGTGNLLAAGYLNDDCRLDSRERAEDDDLIKTDFLIQENPIFRPNKLNFAYPLSLRDFLTIKANPYGYINAQCGTGDFVKGYILNLVYNLNQGMAEVSLLLKYE